MAAIDTNILLVNVFVRIWEKLGSTVVGCEKLTSSATIYCEVREGSLFSRSPVPLYSQFSLYMVEIEPP